MRIMSHRHVISLIPKGYSKTINVINRIDANTGSSSLFNIVGHGLLAMGTSTRNVGKQTSAKTNDTAADE